MPLVKIVMHHQEQKIIVCSAAMFFLGDQTKLLIILNVNILLPDTFLPTLTSPTPPWIPFCFVFCSFFFLYFVPITGENHSHTRTKNQDRGAHGSGSSRKTRNDAEAERSAIENDPVTKEWTSYVVHNYFFYIEMFHIIMVRSLKFDYKTHGKGELELIERVLAMYTFNLRSILSQCRLHLKLMFGTNRARPAAERELVRLQQNNMLFVSHDFQHVLSQHHANVAPSRAGELHHSGSLLGKDVIKYIDDELLNIDDERRSNSSGLMKSIKSYFHG